MLGWTLGSFPQPLPWPGVLIVLHYQIFNWAFFMPFILATTNLNFLTCSHPFALLVPLPNLKSPSSMPGPFIPSSLFMLFHFTYFCSYLLMFFSPAKKAFKTEMKQHLSEDFSISSVQSVSNKNRIFTDINHSQSPRSSSTQPERQRTNQTSL